MYKEKTDGFKRPVLQLHGISPMILYQQLRILPKIFILQGMAPMQFTNYQQLYFLLFYNFNFFIDTTVKGYFN